MATVACCDDISFHGFFFKSLGSLRAKPAVGFWFFVLVLRERNRGGGKVENRFLVFHFSIALVVGAVEMWESRLPLARFPRGSWKEWEACLWLSTLSTAPAFPQLTHLPVFVTPALRLMLLRPGFPPADSSWRALPGSSGCSAR